MMRLVLLLFVTIIFSFTNAANAQVVDTGDKVGVGNTPADAKLHVTGDYNLRLDPISGSSPFYYITSNSADNIIGTNIRTKVGVWNVPDISKSSAYINFITYDPGNSMDGSILFMTRPAGLQSNLGISRMAILNNGNVGIGTNVPKAGFHVSSPSVNGNDIEQYGANLLIEGTATTRSISQGAALGFVVPANADGTNPWQQGRILVAPNNTNTGNAEGKMYIQTRCWGNNAWSWQNNLVLKPNSFVGINTDDPHYHLDVNGQLRGKAFVVEDGEQHTELTSDIMGRCHEILFGATRTKSYDWLNNSMAYTHNGGSYNSGAGAIRFVGNGGQMDFFISPVSTGAGNKIDWGAPVMTMLRNGNVGIGTTAPTNRFEVNGTIRAKEIKVEAGPWPDYVFEDNYQLKSLNDIKAYIKEHKHLPDVPSAEIMAKEGVNLGEVNKLLMQKIEELTLYVIDLEEKNAAQESQLSQIQQLQADLNLLKKMVLTQLNK